MSQSFVSGGLFNINTSSNQNPQSINQANPSGNNQANISNNNQNNPSNNQQKDNNAPNNDVQQNKINGLNYVINIYDDSKKIDELKVKDINEYKRNSFRDNLLEEKKDLNKNKLSFDKSMKIYNELEENLINQKEFIYNQGSLTSLLFKNTENYEREIEKFSKKANYLDEDLQSIEQNLKNNLKKDKSFNLDDNYKNNDKLLKLYLNDNRNVNGAYKRALDSFNELQDLSRIIGDSEKNCCKKLGDVDNFENGRTSNIDYTITIKNINNLNNDNPINNKKTTKKDESFEIKIGQKNIDECIGNLNSNIMNMQNEIEVQINECDKWNDKLKSIIDKHNIKVGNNNYLNGNNFNNNQINYDNNFNGNMNYNFSYNNNLNNNKNMMLNNITNNIAYSNSYANSSFSFRN